MVESAKVGVEIPKTADWNQVWEGKKKDENLDGRS